MRFDWDPSKEDINITKHGIRFSEAAEVFGDVYFEVEDMGIYGEQRFRVYGRTRTLRVLTLVVTYRQDDSGAEVVRIISARRAERSEVKAFYNHLFGL